MRDRFRSRSGFTLVEMVLAIGIAVGILMVALYFYQQSARLRSHLLEEAERMAAARLLLDRLTTDLRSALAQPVESFQGEASSLRFVKAGLGRSSSRSGSTDLQLVTYAATRAREGTNLVVTGISRTEEPLGAKAKPGVTNMASLNPPIAGLVPLPNPIETSAPPAVVQTTAPLTDLIRYLRFSYWDGTGWVESWSSRELPMGVTVTLAFAPIPEGMEAEDVEADIYRRVIAVCAQGSNRQSRPSMHAAIPPERPLLSLDSPASRGGDL